MPRLKAMCLIGFGVALGLSMSSPAMAEPASDLKCVGCVGAGDIADRAIVRSKIKNRAISPNKLNDRVASAIQPGFVTVPAADFVPSRQDFGKFFFDLEGYFIPSNPTNAFCAHAPLNLPLDVNVTDVFYLFYRFSDRDGAISTSLRRQDLVPGSPPVDADRLAYYEDLPRTDGRILSYGKYFAEGDLVTERAQSLWIEVCIEGDGSNARNIRFYAARVGYDGNL